MTESVKCLTLDFGSGHDLMVCRFELHVGLCADSVEPAWDSFCLSPAHSLSFKIKKQTFKGEKNLLRFPGSCDELVGNMVI